MFVASEATPNSSSLGGVDGAIGVVVVGVVVVGVGVGAGAGGGVGAGLESGGGGEGSSFTELVGGASSARGGSACAAR